MTNPDRTDLSGREAAGPSSATASTVAPPSSPPPPTTVEGEEALREIDATVDRLDAMRRADVDPMLELASLRSEVERQAWAMRDAEAKLQLLTAERGKAQAEVGRLKGERDALEADRNQWRRVTQMQTPQGSEFCTPRACEEYLRQQRDDQHRTICGWVTQAKAATAEVSRLQALAERRGKALEAFARAMHPSRPTGGLPDATPVTCLATPRPDKAVQVVSLTAGDFRAAASALSDPAPSGTEKNDGE